jgi:hypothetical protein
LLHLIHQDQNLLHPLHHLLRHHRHHHLLVY